MESRMITLLRDITPPLFWRGARKLIRGSAEPQQRREVELDSSWYDRAFADVESYNRHYRQSPYYFLWCVVVDRVVRSGACSVLDVGCGPGQVANFLHDKGLPSYVGFDFSSNAIEKAKAICPEYEFLVANAYDTDVFTKVKYDTVISLEFLEHIEDDIRVLKMIALGTRFIGSVPSFENPGHVRHFASCEDVRRRYSEFFSAFSVISYENPFGINKYYLFEGIKL